MHTENLEPWVHEHGFAAEHLASAEKRTRWVVVLTAVMMAGEIAAGTVFGSMALLADGWHMATHAAALGVAAFAYAYARRHAENPDFSFGTGKVSALGGFASAVGLAVVAAGVFVSSAARLASPVSIFFDEAIVVTFIGLSVNLACALILGTAHGHHDHGHGHGHGHDDHDHDHEDHADEHRDHNLRGAYLHVLADALTSVCALVALFAGKYLGWSWLDPVMGLVGATLIARWSVSLLRDTKAVLLDAEVSESRRSAIVRAVESGSEDRVADLHVWRVGPCHYAAILSVVTHESREPEHYKRLLASQPDLAHVTVEVNRCPGVPDARVGARPAS